MKLDRAERRKVMALAQARHIDAVLATKLSRWGRSTTDLLATLTELESRRVSLIALNGRHGLRPRPHGRMIATVLAGIAEFERELIQEHPGRKPGPITEAGCWSHGRRKLFDLAQLAKAPLATEAVRR